MENIVDSLEVIYQSIELLIQLDETISNEEHKQMIAQVIEYLEESRRLLYHEKNRLKGF